MQSFLLRIILASDVYQVAAFLSSWVELPEQSFEESPFSFLGFCWSDWSLVSESSRVPRQEKSTSRIFTKIETANK